MSSINLSPEDRAILLALARRTIEKAVEGKSLPTIKLADYSPALQAKGASFVTLHEHGELRGCIGALEPYQPLVQDVCEHAAAAALEDYRFPPVRPAEVPHLHIEISRLTVPADLEYTSPQELLDKLHPGIDGVILQDGVRRATFLPQVWESLPGKESFLTHLCQKMGAPGDLWRRKILKVRIYTVEEFHE